MKSFLTVFKLLLKNTYRASRGKSKKVMILAYVSIGIFYLFMLSYIISSIVNLAPALKETNLTAEALTLMFSGAVILVMFFCIPLVLSSLYFSKDNAFFLSLPVSQSAVYFAKLGIIYLSLISIEAAILVPALITMGVCLGASPLFYVGAFFAVLLLPALPIFLSSIIAMPLMYVVSAFKNRGALSSIVLLVMFMVLFVFQMSIGFFIGESAGGEYGEAIDMASLLTGMSHGMKTAADILVPLSAFARFMTLSPVWGLGLPASMAVNAIIAIGSAAVLAALGLTLSGLFYKKAAAAMPESSFNAGAKKKEFASGGSEIKTLMLKEWRQLIRTPQFAINCLVGAVMPIFLSIFLCYTFYSEMPAVESEADLDMMKSVFAAIVGFIVLMTGIGLNMGALTCITREGEGFAFSKSLPSPAATQIKAKRYLYLIFGYFPALVSLTIAFAVMPNVLPLLFLILCIPYNYAFVSFAVYLDLKSPNLKWTTPQEAIKGNARGLLPYLLNILILLPVVGGGIACRIFAMTVSGELAIVFQIVEIVWWIVIIGVCSLIAYLLDKRLRRKAAMLYDAIEV